MDLEELLDTPIWSASKTLQKVEEAPAVVSVVNKHEINAYGWTTLQDLVQRQPGFSLGQTWNSPTLNSRGILNAWGTDQMLVLIDNVPYNDMASGSSWPFAIPLIFAENVEVLRGPGSVLYGATAMEGVIGINTIEPPGEGVEAHGFGRTGNNGHNTYAAEASAGGALLAGTVAFQYDRDNGDHPLEIDNSGLKDANGQPLKFPIRDGHENSYFFAEIQGRQQLKGFSLQIHDQRWQPQSEFGYFDIIPDTSYEHYENERQIIALTYETPNKESKLVQRYTLRFERNNEDWNVRLLPDDPAFGFPQGITEQFQGATWDLLAQAQLTYSSPFGKVVGGADYAFELFGTSEVHSGNFMVPPPQIPIQGWVNLADLWEPVLGKTDNRISPYAEFVSERFVKNMLQFTAGARYDLRFFDYVDMSTPANVERTRTFGDLSPRATLAFFPTDFLSFKAIAGHSFREPSINELVSMNTFLTVGNINLKPETITSYELAAYWHVVRWLDLRVNGYALQLQNEIGQLANLIPRNLYSRDNAGVEAEVLGGYDFPSAGNLSGFLNYSYTWNINEKISPEAQLPGAELSVEPGTLTWVPAQVAHAGVSYKIHDFSASAQVSYQGEVKRRTTDQPPPLTPATRPETVPDWTTFDAMLSYRVLQWLTLRVQATNLFDAKGSIIFPFYFPSDYPIQRRRVMGVVDLAF
jgi:iron complex outermembrane receptor protein